MLKERTLIILKPDTVHRSLLGAILARFEQKGLKVVGLKMAKLSDVILSEHYVHHKDKPFFVSLSRYMQSAPVVLCVLEGLRAVSAVRLLVGPTKGYDAPPGSIRGDFALSSQTNIVHASDSPEVAQAEIKRFFKEEELFTYDKIDFEVIYGEEERGGS